ncbi:hypothetical protein [Riemerella anatipestifer]|uniref:hypothetical protein n=2 Tax=Riemerella anatipestifer TaxID=34085 RepID=UPI00208E884E|nr:hypothetical protein [Riemerella anatipestifer]MCO4303708.1 hypothetical protein [Riemerella anatipestifer]MCO7352109.1 hypothetical protein [Riemerella anatipestifer]MCQ4039716.1 hypothetical protein [Riemerella anatipestifer]MCT6760622.1 hypothetical protein [Riemerella anatipestifer]MCT6764306.1 hypothetical protein [Riemerella anatipestifer]
MKYKTPGVLSCEGHLFYFWVMNVRNERDVAKIAAQLLTLSMRSKISSLGFKEHYNNNNASVSSAYGFSDYKPGKSKDGSMRWYMNKLSLKMPRHGFIQHYGDDGVREGTKRTRHKPKTTTYNFATHYWKLQEKDFIDDAIKRSGVIDFVLENVSRLRGEEILLSFQNFLQDR